MQRPHSLADRSSLPETSNLGAVLYKVQVLLSASPSLWATVQVYRAHCPRVGGKTVPSEVLAFARIQAIETNTRCTHMSSHPNV